MKSVEFAYRSTNRLTVVLKDEYGGPVTDAAVKVTIQDENGAPLAGISWPQDMLNPEVLPPIPLVGPPPDLAQTYTIVFPPALELDIKEPAFAIIRSESPTVGSRWTRQLIRTTDT